MEQAAAAMAFPTAADDVAEIVLEGKRERRNEWERKTRAIIGLGKALGMEIIAEGVESAEQLDFLLINGCDGIQGYLLSPPVSPSETLTFRKNEISRFFLNLLQRRGYATERGAASE